MTDGSWANPWKLGTIGLAVLFVTALVTELVVAHRFGARADRHAAAVDAAPSPVAAATAPQPAVARAPQPVSSTPTRAIIDACHQQAEQASQRDKAVEVVKDGAIGATGVLGAGVGSLYGLNEDQKHDLRYRDAYAKCMLARGHTG